MKTPNINRFSPLQINKRTLKNRVVVPPMASGTAQIDGLATEKTLEHYARLTEAGIGLVIVEYSYVHASGRSEAHQLGISKDEQIPGLSELAQTIQERGALAGIQITHGGGKSSRGLTGGQLMAPSPIATPVKGDALETPTAMTAQDIELWKSSFVDAAHRAVEAGFDLVEFHAAHGYGLNQWLSPLTNERQDQYGQDLVGRSRLLREIIQTVRKNHPDLLISVRMPGQDFLDGGLSVSDSLALAEMLQNLGVHLIHVSSGIGGWRRPSSRSGEGYLVDEAAKIQARLKIPVIGVGGIETGEYIDQSLRDQKFSLAAVGRAILKDPQSWRQSNLSL